MRVEGSRLLRLAASPTFFALAAINYAGSEGMQALMLVNCRNLLRDAAEGVGVYVPDSLLAALGSMWLMYAVMGVFHAGAWVDLAASDRRRPR